MNDGSELMADAAHEMGRTTQQAMPAQRVRPVFHLRRQSAERSSFQRMAQNGQVAGANRHGGERGAGKGDVRGGE
ncbi:hypothetical protein CAI21_21655 [Alkalilimnicola ehrlichii]|uniref:Uncharacterized protein n=1 Tax=Alkalilimnicola ehrlichii TaxID=351052 RepID=A0A3E0WT62_9GAMM|nr:hypothetical protein CAI21_21655 [Alkalilimnicola ehrlichii]RFA35157.1 hypothetical protein CAL65_13720 [Alkalilimnicola ehrlichii]